MSNTKPIQQTTFALSDERKARSRTKSIPGNPTICVAILSEMTEFALMFIFSFMAKVHYPEIFATGPGKLNTMAGTLALLSSSYFVAKAVHSVRVNDINQAIRWMWLIGNCRGQLPGYQVLGVQLELGTGLRRQYRPVFRRLLHDI